MKAKILIPGFLLLALVAAAIAYYQYNKPHRDAAEEKPAFEITAADLFNEFSANEMAASDKYRDKVVLISGVVMDKSILPDSTVQVVLEVNDPIFGVKCSFQAPGPALTDIGNAIILKGICSGFNADVELNRCVLVK